MRGRTQIKRGLRFFLSLTFLLGLCLGSKAQFTPRELAERHRWEEFLRTARIVSQQQMHGREAVTEPWRLTLIKDGIRRDALWKNAQGRQKGFLENWKWEIEAVCFRRDLILSEIERLIQLYGEENVLY